MYAKHFFRTGKFRPKWNQGSQGYSHVSPREDSATSHPEKTAQLFYAGLGVRHSTLHVKNAQPTNVLVSPLEDGPNNLAGLGVRHYTKGSQGTATSKVQPRLTREDGPAPSRAGLGVRHSTLHAKHTRPMDVLISTREDGPADLVDHRLRHTT
ncbi:hypothetical protein RRG08_003430 [Elysia crispata]|uniref:Uncharacterized protein n=1 Tax=Elysia crispata TaxID=231223 RepID=A0AAE1DVV3_9GAST|nr:hypothetical protein RRG08_003430 [Elysia crispata]